MRPLDCLEKAARICQFGRQTLGKFRKPVKRTANGEMNA
jgi:hypothetical protein